MTNDEIKDTIERSVKEAVHAELGEYKVPKEQHYQDHLWLADWRKWQTTIKSSVLRTVVGVVITGLAALVFYGFLFFGGGGKP